MKTAITHITKCVLLLLVIGGNVNAAFNFVPSRFQYQQIPGCDECNPADGLLHWYFDMDSLKVIEASGEEPAKLQVTIQNRLSRTSLSGLQSQAVTVFNTVMVYNTDAFNNLSEAGECEIGLSPELLARDMSGLLASGAGYSTILSDGDPLSSGEKLVTFNVQSTDIFNELFSQPFRPADQIASIDASLKSTFTLTCNIKDINQEAGLAFNPLNFSGSQYRLYTDPADGNTGTGVTASLLADNDLRGFRLDGKTYAEDYARYGDGTGVRVKFSKGIATPLTPAHFVFEDGVDGTLSTTPMVTNVIHTAGTAYANIEFDQPVNSGVLRLASTQTTVVNDEDKMPLADESFIAALYYDEGAPRATGIQKINGGDTPAQSTSTWSISFTQPINSATVNAKNLCITGDDGICPPDAGTSQMAPFIVSATMDERHTTQLIVVIEEGDGETESIRSLEFRRNAVLGEDLKIVEDYQTALREQIKLEDRIEPVMRITGLKAKIIDDGDDDPATIRYRASFIVHASEPVSGLFIASSYNLLREVDSKWVPVLSHVFNLFAAEITEVSDADGQIIVGRTAYVFVDVDLSTDQATSTTAFALARAGDAMQDSSGQSPQTGPDGLLDPQHIQTARSEIDRTSPIIVVEAQRIASIENRNDTNITYAMNFRVFAIDDQEEKTRENLGHIDQASTYELLRVLNDNSTATISIAPSEIQVTSATAIVRYAGVQLSVAESERTKGFTLGLGSGNVLTDESGNPPVDVNDRRITYRTRIDPRDTAIARIILRINIRTKVFLEGTME